MQRSLERVPKLGAMIKAVSPLKRAAVPEEVVDYIILSGPGSSYINGTGLIADAGATLSVHLYGTKGKSQTLPSVTCLCIHKDTEIESGELITVSTNLATEAKDHSL